MTRLKFLQTSALTSYPDSYWLLTLLACAGVGLGVSITLAQGALLALTAALVVLHYKKVLRLGDFPLWTPVLVYVAAMALSAVTNPRTMASMDSVRTQFVLLFLPVAVLLVSRQRRELAVRWLYAGVGLATAMAAVQLAQGKFPSGGFSHHLTLGGVLSMACAFSACLALGEKGKARWIHAVFCGVAALGVLLSTARGPIVFLALTLAGVCVFRFGKRGLWAAAGLAVTLVLLAGANPLMRTKADEVLNADYSNSNSSIGTRLVLWQTSWDMFLDNPLTGVGLRNWKREAKARITVPVMTTAHAHNIYLQHLSGAGLAGFGALLFFFGSLGKRLLAAARRGDPWAVGGLAAMAVFLLGGLTENVLGDSEVAMACYYLTGLGLPRPGSQE